MYILYKKSIYKLSQEKRALVYRDAFLNDPGGGLFIKNDKQKYYHLNIVLKNYFLNLFEPIREECVEYFKDNKIIWWNTRTHPSGHLLASQISCLNHLFSLRNDQSAATKLLKAIDNEFDEALFLDEGYIEFEKVGKKNLGNEKALTRGEMCTSIDAMMLGKKRNKIVLVLIEWKFTEAYDNEPECILLKKNGPAIWNQHIDLIKEVDSPLNIKTPESLYFEPFYQLMRQTFLGWQMVKGNEYMAVDWLHVEVIPENNYTLRNFISSPSLSKFGNNIETVWKSILKFPEKYFIISPEKLFQNIVTENRYSELTSYLKLRYWD